MQYWGMTLTAFLYMSLDTPLLHVLQPFITAVARRAFWRLLKYFLRSMHRAIIFLVVQMTNDELVFWLAFIGRPLLGSKCLLFDWLILVLLIYLLP